MIAYRKPEELTDAELTAYIAECTNALAGEFIGGGFLGLGTGTSPVSLEVRRYRDEAIAEQSSRLESDRARAVDYDAQISDLYRQIADLQARKAVADKAKSEAGA